VIIDRQPSGTNASRACVVHARTLEVLEPSGITQDLLGQGVSVPIFRVRDRDRSLLIIDFAEIESPYPFTLMCPQDRVERILLDHLEGVGGRVLEELVAARAAASQVEADIHTAGTTRTIAAQWLVGCDGMRSKVRELTGIAFDGAAYEQSFVLADVHMDWPLARGGHVVLFAGGARGRRTPPR
jgi:2-polyprenyl-6-methoxyphenol hydroxylase-like FAD-dependent oxidoreductase